MARYLPTIAGEVAYVGGEEVHVLSDSVLDEVERALEGRLEGWADNAFPALLAKARAALADFRAARARAAEIRARAQPGRRKD